MEELITKEQTMEERILSISEAQSQITRLPEELGEKEEPAIVTRHGKPVLAIMPYVMYRSLLEKYGSLIEQVEALQETMEILQDEEQMAAFRQGVQELAEGKGRPWEEVKKEHGWE